MAQPENNRRFLFVVIVFKGQFASVIPTRYNRPGIYQLQGSATEHSSTCKSHSHKPQQAQCKSHSHKPQQAQYLLVTEERYLSLFYMLVSFPQATTGLVYISYRGALLITLLHVSLIPTSHNRPSIC
jgi:hypothetical protein